MAVAVQSKALSPSSPSPLWRTPSQARGSAAGANPGEVARQRTKVPQVKRVSSARLLVGSMLKRKTENLKHKYSLPLHRAEHRRSSFC
ncbi:hypothetical protein ACP70R_042424 [Stipagrostis hirtigluma subsp. patula]